MLGVGRVQDDSAALWSVAAESNKKMINDQISKQIHKLRKLANNQRVVAIGEVGLDRHDYRVTRYKQQETSEEKKILYGLQRELFIKQVQLAVEVGKPLIIHSREAGDEVLEIVSRIQDSGFRDTAPYLPLVRGRIQGVFHCYEGSKKYAKRILEAGFYISFTGNVTYSHDRLEVAKTIPLKRLLLETDSPLLLPEPMRSYRITPPNPPLHKGENNSGKLVNTPENVKIIASYHAESRGMPLIRPVELRGPLGAGAHGTRRHRRIVEGPAAVGDGVPQSQDARAFSQAVLADLVDVIVSTGARRLELPAAPPQPRTKPEVAEALLGHINGHPFEAPSRVGAELARRLDQWSRPISGAANVKLIIVLDEPDSSGTWYLRVMAPGTGSALEPIESAMVNSSNTRRKDVKDQMQRLETLYPVLLRPGGRRRGEVILSQDEAWQLDDLDRRHADRGRIRGPGAGPVPEEAEPALRLTSEDAQESVVGARQLANVRWSVLFDDVELTAADISRLAAQARPLVMSNGKWVELSKVDLAQAARALADRSDSTKLSGADMLRHALGLEGSPLSGGISIAGEGWAADLLRSASSVPSDLPTKPEGFRGELRHYQAEALAWLGFLDTAGLGGCLALDMGLGKTPTMLAHLRRTVGSGPVLVIAPRRWSATGLGSPQVRSRSPSRGASRPQPGRAPRHRQTARSGRCRDHDLRHRRSRRRGPGQDRLGSDHSRRGPGHQERHQRNGPGAAHDSCPKPGGPDRNTDRERTRRPVGDHGLHEPGPGRESGPIHLAVVADVADRWRGRGGPPGPQRDPGVPPDQGRTGNRRRTARPDRRARPLLDDRRADRALPGRARYPDQGDVRAGHRQEEGRRPGCDHGAQADLQPSGGLPIRRPATRGTVRQAGPVERDRRQRVRLGRTGPHLHPLRHLGAEARRLPVRAHRSPDRLLPRWAGSDRSRHARSRVPEGRRSRGHGAVAQGRWDGPQPDSRQPRGALRPLVESGGGRPGPRPGLAHRAEEHRDRPPVGVPRHGRRTGRGSRLGKAPHRRPGPPEGVVHRRPRCRTAPGGARDRRIAAPRRRRRRGVRADRPRRQPIGPARAAGRSVPGRPR